MVPTDLHGHPRLDGEGHWLVVGGGKDEDWPSRTLTLAGHDPIREKRRDAAGWTRILSPYPASITMERSTAPYRRSFAGRSRSPIGVAALRFTVLRTGRERGRFAAGSRPNPARCTGCSR